jgi:hypothetical protein
MCPCALPKADFSWILIIFSCGAALKILVQSTVVLVHICMHRKYALVCTISRIRIHEMISLYFQGEVRLQDNFRCFLDMEFMGQL